MAEDAPTDIQHISPDPHLTDPLLTVRRAEAALPARARLETPVGFDQFPLVPGYELIAELGRGGMGVVYEARQRNLNRRVALKMIRGMTGVSAADVARFLAEAEVLASVRHPNVVQVYECGTTRAESAFETGVPFIALELVSGGTLAHRLFERGRLDPRTAAGLLAAVADGVQAVHDAGIVHRDLKPANILLGTGPESAADGAAPTVVPKVTDFGVARRDGSDLTLTGVAVGTPDYMAPEQAAGRSKFVGPTADVWALGVILFELLTGYRPFRGDDVWSIVHKVIHQTVPSVRRAAPGAPRDLELICHKCLEKEPYRRYATAAELAADLRRFLGGEPVSVRPLGPVSRVWRAGRRNPVVTMLVSVIVLSNALGAGMTLQQMFDARRNAARATAEADRAKTQEENATREADTARTALVALRRESDARKAADDFTLRTARTALYARELGDAWRALAGGDVSEAERALAACDPGTRGWEWHVLDRWLARTAPVLPPVTGAFGPSRLVVSPDGRWVAASGLPVGPDGPPFIGAEVVWLWNFGAGGPPVAFKSRGVQTVSPVRVLAFDATSERVVAASDYVVRVWNLNDPARPLLDVTLAPFDDGRRKAPLPLLAAVHLSGEQVRAVVCSRGDAPAKIVTWSLTGAAGSTESEIDRSAGTAVSAFAPDGKSLLLAGGERHRFLQRVGTDGTVLGGPVPVDGTAAFVGFAPDGVGAVLGTMTGSDGELAAWDGVGPKFARRTSFRGVLKTVEVQRDGRALVATQANELWVWDPATGAVASSARFDRVGGVAAFPDSRRVVVGDLDRGVRIWNTVPPYEVVRAHRARFPVTAFSDDRLLQTDWESGQVSIRGSETGAPVEHTPDGADARFRAAAWVGDRVALVRGDTKPAVLLYDPATRSVSYRWARSTDVVSSALAADRDRVAFPARAVGSGEHVVHVADANTGAVRTTLRVPADGALVEFLALAPTGKHLAATRMRPLAAVSGPPAARPAGRLTLWDIESGTVVWDAEVPVGARAPVFSADGGLVAAGTWGRAVVARRVGDGTVAREFLAPTNRSAGHFGTQNLAFSPDGTRLIGAGADGLTVWDVTTGQVVLALPTPGERVSFSSDGRRLYVSSPKQIVVFDAGTHQPAVAEVTRLP